MHVQVGRVLDRLLSQVVRAIDPRYAGLDSSECADHLYMRTCMHVSMRMWWFGLLLAYCHRSSLIAVFTIALYHYMTI